MSVQCGFVLLSLLVTCESTSMHGLPCSSLGHCFGNLSDVNPDPPTPLEQNNSRRSRDNQRLPAAGPVVFQPEAPRGSPLEEHDQPHRTVSCISTQSHTRTREVNETSSNSICHMQDRDDEPGFESPPHCHSLSLSSEDEELECSPELELKYPQIPRPSIIILQSEVRRLLTL